MPEFVKNDFNDELPMNMQGGIESPVDDLPMDNAPQQQAPREKGPSFEERSKALFNKEPIAWGDIRKMKPEEIDAALLDRGIFSQKELDTINTFLMKLKGSINVDEIKANVLGPSNTRAGSFYNLYAIANCKKTNPMPVLYYIGDGFSSIVLPTSFKTYEKKDGSLGIERTTHEKKIPSLYIIKGSNDKLFPPLSKNMSESERNLANSLREFEMAFLDRNGIAVRASVDSKGNITTKPMEVRLWNEESKSWETKPCFVCRKDDDADYRLDAIPVDKIMDRLEDNPTRKVWLADTSYTVDLANESAEARYNIAAGGGAWVKGKDAQGNAKNLYVIYNGTDKYANIKVGTSPRALREELRERAAARQADKKARENKQQKTQQQEASPRHTLR